MEPELAIGSFQVSIAAKAYGKNFCRVRASLIYGWMTIRKTRSGKLVTTITENGQRIGKNQLLYLPKLLYEQTGYAWQRER